MTPEIETVIQFKTLTVEDAKSGYPELWFTCRQYFPDIEEERLAVMVSIATQICPHCYSAPRGCPCWNDE